MGGELVMPAQGPCPNAGAHLRQARSTALQLLQHRFAAGYVEVCLLGLQALGLLPVIDRWA
jgi:hypothetical protein